MTHGHDNDHEHGHGEGDDAENSRRRFEPPAADMVVRGLFMTAGAIAASVAALRVVRAGVGGIAAAPALAAAALLLAWAGAIHLTGGEKFDDHPWV
jgi:hypothetical protein